MHLLTSEHSRQLLLGASPSALLMQGLSLCLSVHSRLAGSRDLQLLAYHRSMVFMDMIPPPALGMVSGDQTQVTRLTQQALIP